MKCDKKCLEEYFIKRFCCQLFSYFQLKSTVFHRTTVLLMISRDFQNTLYDSWLVLFVPNSWAVNGIVKLKHIRKARLFSFSLSLYSHQKRTILVKGIRELFMHLVGHTETYQYLSACRAYFGIFYCFFPILSWLLVFRLAVWLRSIATAMPSFWLIFKCQIYSFR